jgi:hypothetical protein
VTRQKRAAKGLEQKRRGGSKGQRMMVRGDEVAMAAKGSVRAQGNKGDEAAKRSVRVVLDLAQGYAQLESGK